MDGGWVKSLGALVLIGGIFLIGRSLFGADASMTPPPPYIPPPIVSVYAPEVAASAERADLPRQMQYLASVARATSDLNWGAWLFAVGAILIALGQIIDGIANLARRLPIEAEVRDQRADG